MTTQFTAAYEHGVLRPTVPVSLAEGTQVEVFIISKPATPDHRTPAEILAEIAAMPTSGGDPFTGRDHDKVLYGEQGAR
jgi:predicted DNA-binding antitoxin AbrB/MazE fold protein